MIELLLRNVTKSNTNHTIIAMSKFSGQNKIEPDTTDESSLYVNRTNASGQTALCRAAEKGLVKSVKQLLVHWSSDDERQKLEIESAVKSNNGEILTAILEKIGWEKQPQILHLACKYNNNRKVAACTDSMDMANVTGCDNITGLIAERLQTAINQTDDNGYTPLLVAAHFGHYECVKYLSEKLSAKKTNGGELNANTLRMKAPSDL
jgi:ankyrin repeat protein